MMFKGIDVAVAEEKANAAWRVSEQPTALVTPAILRDALNTHDTTVMDFVALKCAGQEVTRGTFSC